MVGCCPNRHAVEPLYPKDELGWKDSDSGFLGVRIKGRFVLRKGEATDNGKVQIKVLEIIPPRPCAEAAGFDAQARVRFQFVRMSDKQVLCEDVFAENGGGNINPCGESVAKLGVSGIGVHGINLKEGWVYFVV